MRKLEATFGAIGATLAAHKLLILIALAILIVFLLFVVIVSRKKTADAGGASAGPPAPTPEPSVDPYLLRAAWLRFQSRLPGAYRRSLLNFEQFVVMGGPASGKSRVIDAYSDWKQQTREFPTHQADDPDLPVYLASNELIMELPAPILDDQSEVAYQLLNNLWRPIYQERGPTVVAVVDVARLMQAPPHVISDLAQKMRGKINVLTDIRKRSVEVRVALTHFDELEGYEELTEFCRDHEIPLWVAPSANAAPAEIGRGFDAWFDDLRGYLPNALVSLDAARFRRVVAFLSRAPEISAAVRPFLKALFQYEAVLAEPIYGGIYFASETPGVSNPLQGALESGPGPDPKRRHLVAAAALGVISLGFLGNRFNAQYARWSVANESLELYRVADDFADEPYRRADVIAFTSKHNGFWDRHPDFFGSARGEMRKRFSDRIREHYFVKGLRTVAEAGARFPEGTPMAARRSVYYLGLIHSDKSDKLHILEPGQTEIWASMIELHRDSSFLSDYLANIDEAYKTPVAFQLANQGVDPSDGSREWVDLFDALNRALADGIVSRAELSELQTLAKALRGRLDRFENDSVMKRALHDIDLAAGTEIIKDGEPQHPGPLERNYHLKLETFERHVAWAEDPDLRRTLRHLLDLVNAAAIDVALPHTLGDLVFRLEQLYNAGPAQDSPTSAGAAGPIQDSQTTVVNIDGTERRLPSGQWAQITRDSRAEQYIEGFLSGPIDQGILFGVDAETLGPVRWNPNGAGAAVFVGTGVLNGRYTKVAYDTYIRDVVVRLGAVLARAHTRTDRRAALNLVVADQVAGYAARYREEGLRFAQSFDVQAGSQEALRVALAQMSSDTSAFNDFLVALDQNTRLDAPPPLLSSVGAEMGTFDSWHLAVGDAGGAPELGKYKAILGQLLVDLGPPAGGGSPEPAPPAAGAPPAVSTLPGDTGTETLEKLLTPAGRIYLAWLRGEKGSYGALVENWLTSLRMPEPLRKPFRAPLRRLAELGRQDIERVISRMWLVDMLPSLQRVAMKFPFDRAATEEATPDELRELFHPKEGRMFNLFRRYVEPLSQISGTSGFHPMPAVARSLSLPPELYTAVNSSVMLSTRLWDQAGNPTPMELRISTVRFDRRAVPRQGEPDRGNVLTLMYLNLGEASVFNFNQQPSLVTVGFDWTKDHRSQLGIQLTDILTKENSFPPPIVSRGTYWSFHHLLLQAKVSAVKSPRTAQLHTWDVWAQPESGAGEMIPVRFVMVNDPWEPFAGIGHFAPRPKDPPKGASKDVLSFPPPPPAALDAPRGTM